MLTVSRSLDMMTGPETLSHSGMIEDERAPENSRTRHRQPEWITSRERVLGKPRRKMQRP